MKKFFSLMLVALVMLGVTACEQNVTIDTPKSEGLSFYAEIAMTRASINDEDGDKIWNTTWEGNDTLRVTDAENNSFDFVYSTTELNKFTCENPEASILVGKSVTIELVNEIPVSYNREKGLVINEQVDSFNPNSEEPIVLNPKNSFLRFTNNCYNGANITLTYPESFNCAPFVVDTNNTTSNTFSTSDSGDILVSFLVPEYNEDEYPYGVPATLSYSTNGHICKEKVLKIKAGKVYNLGELVEAEPAKIYLVPNSDWKQANAWFVAHLYDSADNYADKTLTDADADGVYECTVPAGMEKVIFCRMDSAVSNFSWDKVWNQTAETEIGVAPNNYYYINGWETGFWETADYEEPAIVWALSGGFNDWSEDACIMEATSTENLFVAKNITLEAGGAFKVKDSTTWDTNFGAGISYLKANNYMSVVKGSQTNITVEAAGTYDIYFEYLEANSKLYLMASGIDYTTAVEQTVNGEEPVQEEPEVTANMLYLKPNSNWTLDSARFAAYFFKDAENNVWVSMVESDSEGIYEVNIPEGYVFGENVIFCRMNPSTTSNNWNNKWNQTSDLVIPTDGKNLYTVADGTWDNGGGTWSTK